MANSSNLEIPKKKYLVKSFSDHIQIPKSYCPDNDWGVLSRIASGTNLVMTRDINMNSPPNVPCFQPKFITPPTMEKTMLFSEEGVIQMEAAAKELKDKVDNYRKIIVHSDQETVPSKIPTYSTQRKSSSPPKIVISSEQFASKTNKSQALMKRKTSRHITKLTSNSNIHITIEDLALSMNEDNLPHP